MESILDEAVEVCEIDEFKGKMKNYKGAYVYAFFNKINKKVYIGSSRRLVGRFSNYHRAISKTAKFHSLLLKRVFNKYSRGDFWFLILENVENPEKIVDREQFYLDKYKPFGKRGYNCATSASSNFGVKHSEETRKKSSLRQQGEKSNRAKLKNADIIGIFHDSAWSEMSRDEVARKYKISKRQILEILDRNQWKHIEIEQETLDKLKERRCKRLSKRDSEEIANRLKNGEEPSKLSKDFGVPVCNIHNINKGRSYPHLKDALSPNQEYISKFEYNNTRDEKKREEIKNYLKLDDSSTINELCKKFNVSSGIINDVKRDMNIQKPQKVLSPEKAREVGLLLKEGLHYKEIMLKCDICQVSIARINRGQLFPEVKEEIGPSSLYIRIPPRVVLLSVKKKMVSFLKKDADVKEIMSALALSRSYVNQWKRKFRKKHSQTQNFQS